MWDLSCLGVEIFFAFLESTHSDDLIPDEGDEDEDEVGAHDELQEVEILFGAWEVGVFTGLNLLALSTSQP